MPQHTLVGWLVGGLGVSLIAGSIVTYLVWSGLRRWFYAKAQRENWGVTEEQIGRIKMFPILIGVLERGFFTILIAFEVSGVASGMLTWVVVKMVSGWNLFTGGDHVWRRALGFTALINSLVSLLFAVVGGLIANGRIPISGR